MVNFGKNLRLSQIQPIKTSGIKSIQFGKKKGKTLHPVYVLKPDDNNILSIARPLARTRRESFCCIRRNISRS
jgi:hypothetical protein